MTTNRTRRIPADAAEVSRFFGIRNRDIDRFLNARPSRQAWLTRETPEAGRLTAPGHSV